MINNVELATIIANSIKNNEVLNKNHYVYGDTVMYDPFTFAPCLSIIRRIPDGDRKEFEVSIKDCSVVNTPRRIKVIYRKNLKMPEGKVASQVAHAVKNLGPSPMDCDIIVLRVSDKKFNELINENPHCFIQVDKGLTVVDKGTKTAAAWFIK